MALSEKTAARARRKGLLAGCVSLKIRRADFTTFTRQRRFQPASNDTANLYHLAAELLDRWLSRNPDVELRLLGVGLSHFSEADQLDLFEGPASASPVDNTVDRIRERFGNTSIQRGRGVKVSGDKG